MLLQLPPSLLELIIASVSIFNVGAPLVVLDGRSISVNNVGSAHALASKEIASIYYLQNPMRCELTRGSTQNKIELQIERTSSKQVYFLLELSLVIKPLALPIHIRWRCPHLAIGVIKTTKEAAFV